ncbi:MAG: DUF2079 domain-containing protein [Lachnospiraceae bacterium]|nr:DUF2079 domain-containing protein [Lachnospiraceae bacterium]
MIMKEKIDSRLIEKLILRLFSVWCVSTVMESGKAREVLYTFNSTKLIDIKDMIVNMIMLFVLISLLDFIYERFMKFKYVDIVVYVLSVMYFGVNAVFRNNDVYLAATVVLGVVLCICYVTKKYGDKLLKVQISTKVAVIGLSVVALSVFVLMGMLTVLRYKLYYTSTFDFGIFAQMFYNMKETLLPMTTCERSQLLSHFSVHVSPIFYLILPIYWIFPYNETLIIVQLLFIISGVIPLYLICRNRKFSNTLTLLVSLVYLLSPVLINGLFYDFHENKFLTTLILWLLYFVEKDKQIGIYIFAILVLMVKEDAGIYVACVGLYILATKIGKKKIPGAIIFITSVIWFLLAYRWLNSGGDGAMTGRYQNFIGNSESGVYQILITIFKNPAYFFKQLLSVEKLKHFLWILIPVMFMQFRIKSVKELILLIPFLVINAMPSYVYQYDIAHQYYYGSMALMLYLVVVNLSEYSDKEKVSTGIWMVAASMIMFTALVTTKFSYFDTYKEFKDRNEQIAKVLEAIPQEASVSVTTYMMPNISMREEIYRYPAGEGCDYVVFDLTRVSTRSQYETDAKKLMSEEYELVEHIEDAIIVVKKKDSN